VASGSNPTIWVVYASTVERNGLMKITDGGRPVGLVSGQAGWPSVTGDDRAVVFVSTRGANQSLWMVPIDGGAPTLVANRSASQPMLSPDGKTVAFKTNDDRTQPVLAICTLSDCASPRLLPPQPAGGGNRIRWTPDARGFLYIAGSIPNLWVESLDGKPPRQLTHFTDNQQIADAAWSHTAHASPSRARRRRRTSSYSRVCSRANDRGRIQLKFAGGAIEMLAVVSPG
jgi:Tol biopolymer transport system component